MDAEGQQRGEQLRMAIVQEPGRPREVAGQSMPQFMMVAMSFENQSFVTIGSRIIRRSHSSHEICSSLGHGLAGFPAFEFV